MKLRPPLYATFLLLAPAASGALYWDGGYANIADPGDGVSAGGSGTWDLTLKNWDQVLDQPHLAWDNTAEETAIIAGAAGDIIDIGVPITAAALTLNGPVTVDLTANDLTLNGSTIGTGINATAAATIKSTDGTGYLVVGANQKWTNSSGILTISAPVDTGTNLLTLETKSNNLDVSGKISGTGGLTITSAYTSGTTPTATSNPTLNNANDYTGTTTVSGWIWLNSGGLAAFGADPSDLVFNTGGVRLTGTGTVTRGIILTGNSGISKTAGTTTLEGKITGTGNLVISANFGATSPVVLAAANDFTGDCVNGPDGIVRLAHVDALSKASMTWADNNGRSAYDLTTSNLAYIIGGLKSVTNKSGNLNLGTGLGGDGTGAVSFGTNNQSNTYIGVLSGAAGFTKIGSGTQTLIGENAYTGNTVVAEGTLKLGKIAGQTGISCTTGASGTNVKRLTNLATATVNNAYIGQAVTGALIPAGARITQINSTSQVTLDLGPTTVSTPTSVNFADMLGTIAASPIIEVKSGATLDVASYPWTLEASQTLGGTGTVVGTITAAGTLAPGLAATGTLTTGDVSLTGTFTCTLDGADCDKLAASALTLSSAKLSFSIANPPTTASYVIATYTGAAPAPFAVVENLPSGYGLDYATPGEIRLVGGSTPPAYDTWATAAGLTPANHAKDQDPDFDGVNNLLEFAMGGNPLSGSNGGKLLAVVQEVSGSPALTLTLAVRNGATFAVGPNNTQTATVDGITYQIESSFDLTNWNGAISEVTPAMPLPAPDESPPTGYQYHTFKTAGPVSTILTDLIRVKVSE